MKQDVCDVMMITWGREGVVENDDCCSCLTWIKEMRSRSDESVMMDTFLWRMVLLRTEHVRKDLLLLSMVVVNLEDWLWSFKKWERVDEEDRCCRVERRREREREANRWWEGTCLSHSFASFLPFLASTHSLCCKVAFSTRKERKEREEAKEGAMREQGEGKCTQEKESDGMMKEKKVAYRREREQKIGRKRRYQTSMKGR